MASERSSLSPRAARWLLLAFFTFFTLFGGLFVVLFIVLPWQRSRTARTWPSVSATILESDVVRTNGHDNGPTYRPEIAYRYAVDGEQYEGNTYGPRGGSYSNSDRSWAAKAIRPYPKGAETRVFYNPADPFDSMVMRDWSLGAEAFVLIFPTVGLLGLVGTLYWMIFRRPAPEAATAELAGR